MDTADGNSLGALFYYTNVVYSVSVIRSDVDLADVARGLSLMCREPPLFILSRFIAQGVVYYISGEGHIKSKPNFLKSKLYCTNKQVFLQVLKYFAPVRILDQKKK